MINPQNLNSFVGEQGSDPRWGHGPMSLISRISTESLDSISNYEHEFGAKNLLS